MEQVFKAVLEDFQNCSNPTVSFTTLWAPTYKALRILGELRGLVQKFCGGLTIPAGLKKTGQDTDGKIGREHTVRVLWATGDIPYYQWSNPNSLGSDLKHLQYIKGFWQATETAFTYFGMRFFASVRCQILHKLIGNNKDITIRKHTQNHKWIQLFRMCHALILTYYRRGLTLQH